MWCIKNEKPENETGQTEPRQDGNNQTQPHRGEQGHPQGRGLHHQQGTRAENEIQPFQVSLLGELTLEVLGNHRIISPTHNRHYDHNHLPSIRTFGTSSYATHPGHQYHQHHQQH